MDIYRPQPQASALGTRVDIRAVMKEVYLWMTLGLLTSAIVALVFALSGLTEAIFPVLIIAPFAQIGVVWYLSARITRMEASRATNVFLLFAALMGVTLSTVFYWAALTDIYLALFATGAMFAAMSIVGYTTEMDLTRLGSLLFMALIGLIAATIVNIFLASETLYWLVSYAGVLIFVGLTAYDTQWIKRQAQQLEVQGANTGAAVVRQVAIMGALKLYLDFINLFLYILRIISRDR
ncbi:MAG: Bax inhibitor-1/YccA family protein [Anaerolineae bacterium]|nr:Bax inhibitor-1/YccA family protein [Anaerolineae bacterium]MEB2288350.1 Bax inhibitor-1/YccA family protein [Anaerolineae bacterium]